MPNDTALSVCGRNRFVRMGTGTRTEACLSPRFQVGEAIASRTYVPIEAIRETSRGYAISTAICPMKLLMVCFSCESTSSAIVITSVSGKLKSTVLRFFRKTIGGHLPPAAAVNAVPKTSSRFSICFRQQSTTYNCPASRPKNDRFRCGRRQTV
jgi:hypothetical protein